MRGYIRRAICTDEASAGGDMGNEEINSRGAAVPRRRPGLLAALLLALRGGRPRQAATPIQPGPSGPPPPAPPRPAEPSRRFPDPQPRVRPPTHDLEVQQAIAELRRSLARPDHD